MGQKIITLSGAATSVLYALFYRGALQSGELPAKSGAAELREMGFAETRHTATKYQKENYFTFLTAEGQDFAIKHLVDMQFGVTAGGYVSVGNAEFRIKDSADQTRCVVGSLSGEREMKVGPINIELNIDTTDAQKALDDIQKVINESSQAFESFQERVRKETTSVTWSGSLTLGINRNLDALIDNAVESNAESERIKAAMEEATKKATIDAVATVLKDFKTRGPLRRALGI